MSNMQRQLSGPGPLLKRDGSLAEVGWARQPVLSKDIQVLPFTEPDYLHY